MISTSFASLSFLVRPFASAAFLNSSLLATRPNHSQNHYLSFSSSTNVKRRPSHTRRFHIQSSRRTPPVHRSVIVSAMHVLYSISPSTPASQTTRCRHSWPHTVNANPSRLKLIILNALRFCPFRAPARILSIVVLYWRLERVRVNWDCRRWFFLLCSRNT